MPFIRIMLHAADVALSLIGSPPSFSQIMCQYGFGYF